MAALRATKADGTRIASSNADRLPDSVSRIALQKRTNIYPQKKDSYAVSNILSEIWSHGNEQLIFHVRPPVRVRFLGMVVEQLKRQSQTDSTSYSFLELK